MATRQQQFKPGELFTIRNEQHHAQRVRISTPGETIVETLLSPGGELVITVGREALNIDISEAEPGYHGLQRVK